MVMSSGRAHFCRVAKSHSVGMLSFSMDYLYLLCAAPYVPLASAPGNAGWLKARML